MRSDFSLNSEMGKYLFLFPYFMGGDTKIFCHGYIQKVDIIFCAEKNNFTIKNYWPYYNKHFVLSEGKSVLYFTASVPLRHAVPSPPKLPDALHELAKEHVLTFFPP